MKLKHLIAELEGVKTWEEPKVALEQYPTSPDIAAHMLLSALEEGDIEDAMVADLGSGGGILGIGAAILGASHVVAFDIDPDALRVAAENVAEFEVPIDLVCCDLQQLSPRLGGEGVGCFDCVVTNPPFGTQKDSNGVDMVFLRRGLDMCKQARAAAVLAPAFWSKLPGPAALPALHAQEGAVYSLHKSSTRAFIQKKVAEWGAEAKVVAQLRFEIPKMRWSAVEAAAPAGCHTRLPHARQGCHGRRRNARVPCPWPGSESHVEPFSHCTHRYKHHKHASKDVDVDFWRVCRRAREK